MQQEPVQLTTNIKSPYQITELNISINGNLNNTQASHFFYQVEDGHGFIAIGKITTDQDGHFDTIIEFDKSLTNPHGAILFYLDSDEDGHFY